MRMRTLPLATLAGATLLLLTAGAAEARIVTDGDAGAATSAKSALPTTANKAPENIKLARKGFRGGRGGFRAPRRSFSVRSGPRSPGRVKIHRPGRGVVIHRRIKRPRILRYRTYVPTIVVVPRVYRYQSSSCSYWHRRCVANWGYSNSDYRGCMRYHGCRPR